VTGQSAAVRAEISAAVYRLSEYGESVSVEVPAEFEK